MKRHISNKSNILTSQDINAMVRVVAIVASILAISYATKNILSPRMSIYMSVEDYKELSIKSRS